MKHKGNLLLPDERVMDTLTATFEVTENIGVIYKFGDLMATNKRLILYTINPLFGLRKAAVFRYEDVSHVDAAKSLFSFQNDVSFAVKWVNQGNEKLLLTLIKLYANHTLSVRDI